MLGGRFALINPATFDEEITRIADGPAFGGDGLMTSMRGSTDPIRG
jgi:hypothetical protein